LSFGSQRCLERRPDPRFDRRRPPGGRRGPGRPAERSSGHDGGRQRRLGERVDAGTGIRQIRPETKLIFLTREDSDAARFAALESGASAFIHKSRAASEVVDAIRVVAGGGTLITPRTIATLLNKRRSMDAQLESLTPREKEVLRLMAEGVSSREIASKLGISYTTVRTHIRSLGSKLGVHSKLQAIVKARELALVE